jgi:drug/metabolite transporter (DMT)-like permease
MSTQGKPAGWFKGLVIGGMLLFGTCTVVIQKIIFSLKGDGRAGKNVGIHHEFKKPWFQTEVMFLGMFGCLAVYEGTNLFKYLRNRRRLSERTGLISDQDSASISESPKDGPSRIKQYVLVMAPAMCDLVATAMMNIGLLWINASVWQMLRGSMVVFSALFSKLFLKRPLVMAHWVGVGIVVFALLVVAFSALMKPCQPCDLISSSSNGEDLPSTTTQKVLGTILVVLAQIIQASQIVVEEFLLAEVNLPATLIVGLEGLWGGIVCSIVLIIVHQIPVPYGEDSIDTFLMLGKNYTILLTAFAYAIAILCYNMFGMLVTQVSSAVIRTILEGMRTACIWVTNLFIHYVITRSLGESWTEWSYLQFCGFLFLLLGLLVYNGIAQIQGIPWRDPKKPLVPQEEPKEEPKEVAAAPDNDTPK